MQKVFRILKVLTYLSLKGNFDHAKDLKKMFFACMEKCSLAYLNFPSEIQTGCIVFIVISSLSVDCSVTQAYLFMEFFSWQ